MKYPKRWNYLAHKGWLAGRLRSESLHDNEDYRNLFPLGVTETIFRKQFERGRATQLERIAEGREQPPGSVYDPKLDDGQ